MSEKVKKHFLNLMLIIVFSLIIIIFAVSFDYLDVSWKDLEEQKTQDEKIHEYCVDNSHTMIEYVNCNKNALNTEVSQ